MQYRSSEAKSCNLGHVFFFCCLYNSNFQHYNEGHVLALSWGAVITSDYVKIFEAGPGSQADPDSTDTHLFFLQNPPRQSTVRTDTLSSIKSCFCSKSVESIVKECHK